MDRTALLKTRTHQDYVLHAIAAFVAKNGRFPCPADPRITNASYGVEQIQCRGLKARGILPFKSLGISESYAKDGYHRLMTYVIEQELAKKGADLSNEEGGLITVKNEEGNSVLAPLQKGEKNPNYVALILLSHGKSGAGAFTRGGDFIKAQGGSESPSKRENYDDNLVFTESLETGDILRWETRNQFLQYYVKQQI